MSFLPALSGYTSKSESIVSTWRIRNRLAASATDASARSKGRSANRSLMTRTSASEVGEGRSTSIPPRCDHRKKSSDASLPIRRESNAQTSVATGQVVTRRGPGFSRTHSTHRWCHRSERLKSASSGPLSTTTRFSDAQRPFPCLAMATATGLLFERSTELCLSGDRKVGGPAEATKQVLAEGIGRRRLIGVSSQPVGERFAQNDAGRHPERSAASTKVALEKRPS